MKLYLVRHGQTDWNLEKRAQGRQNNPLNAEGIRQAEELREKLKNYEFDICYCSPLLRAKQTAEIAVDGRVETIYDDNLVERGFGTLEGTLTTDWDLATIFQFDYSAPGTGMETVREVFARSKKFLERVKTEQPDDAKVLVVAHGFLLKTMYFNAIGYDEKTVDLKSFYMHNVDVVEVEI